MVAFAAKLVLIVICLAVAPTAADYGRSVEDLVGVFSIEKTIRLGDASCFGTPGGSDQAALPPLAGPDELALASFNFEPKVIEAGASPQEMIFLASVRGGPRNLTATFRSPSGSQVAAVVFDPVNLAGGLYSGRMVLPGEREPGAWLLEGLEIEGGSRGIMLYRDNLSSLGLPAEFLVA